jgi:hypothetical protein
VSLRTQWRGAGGEVCAALVISHCVLCAFVLKCSLLLLNTDNFLPNPNLFQPDTHSMSSQMVNLKALNRVTLEEMNGCIGKELRHESYIPEKPVLPFQHGFNMLSTPFHSFFAIFNIFSLFFVFSLKATESANKPNPKRIFIKCRYTDTKPCSSLKPSAPKNKPSQTRRACHFAPPTATCVTCAVKRRRACHFAPPRATCITCAVKRRCACHFAPLNSLSQRSVRERVGVRAAYLSLRAAEKRRAC